MDQVNNIVCNNVRTVQKRINTGIFVRSFFRALWFCGIIAAFILFISKFTDVPYSIFYVLGLLVILFAVRLARPLFLSIKETALFIDMQLKTKEVVTQAVEIESASERERPAFCNQAVETAELLLSKKSEKVSFAIYRPADFVISCAVFILCGVIILLPSFSRSVSGSDNGEKQAKANDETINKLATLSKKLERQAHKLGNSELMKFAKEIAQLAKKLEKQEITKKHAVARADKIKTELDKLKQDADAKRALMEQMGKNNLTQDIAKAMESAKHDDVSEISEKLADKKGDELNNALNKLQSDHNELKKMLDKPSKSLKKGDNNKFAQQMKGLSESLENLPFDDGEFDEDMEDALSQLDELEDELLERQLAREELSEAEGTDEDDSELDDESEDVEDDSDEEST
ncbi:MAG: hypothetical protein HY606_04080 [Planctomycetes bacterium]|nr:hypothetical protein [Planctomycetota bacterium]